MGSLSSKAFPLSGCGLPLGRRLPAAPKQRSEVDLDPRHSTRGGSKFDKLSVVNRGTGTAYDVELEFPENAALSHIDSAPIAKIPSNKSVTVDVMNYGRMMGARRSRTRSMSECELGRSPGRKSSSTPPRSTALSRRRGASR